MVRGMLTRGAARSARGRFTAPLWGLGGAMVAALALVAGAPVSAHARPHVEKPAVEDVRDMGSDFRDAVVHQSLPLRARSSRAYGRRYSAGGSTVSVSVSPKFQADDALLQKYADFVGALVHGPELERLHIYIASDSELTRLCGAYSAACYYPGAERMVVPGTPSRDGTSVEAILAHEYGHHVATNRDNAPWQADETGPKYWATAKDICRRTRAGTVFPGDESDHYELNPGEGWAEVYRELNEEGSWDGIVSDFFRPHASDLLRA
jgi:hypothetical protein